MLGEFDTDFAKAIRLDQYYPNPRAVAAYHLSRHDTFKDYIPPIAVMPEPEYEIRKIYPPKISVRAAIVLA